MVYSWLPKLGKFREFRIIFHVRDLSGVLILVGRFRDLPDSKGIVREFLSAFMKFFKLKICNWTTLDQEPLDLHNYVFNIVP